MTNALLAEIAPRTWFHRLGRAWQNWRDAQVRTTIATCCGAADIERTAHDLALSKDALLHAAGAPGGAALLRQRMAETGLAPADATTLGPGVWYDMQRTCCECGEKQRCDQDLAQQPQAATWHDYCANSETIEELARSHARQADRP